MQNFWQYYGFDWIALTLGTIGIWKVGNKNRNGFLFYIAAATSGLIFSYLAHSYAYMIVNIISITLQTRAYIHWKQMEAATL